MYFSSHLSFPAFRLTNEDFSTEEFAVRRAIVDRLVRVLQGAHMDVIVYAAEGEMIWEKTVRQLELESGFVSRLVERGPLTSGRDSIRNMTLAVQHDEVLLRFLVDVTLNAPTWTECTARVRINGVFRDLSGADGVLDARATTLIQEILADDCGYDALVSIAHKQFRAYVDKLVQLMAKHFGRDPTCKSVNTRLLRPKQFVKAGLATNSLDPIFDARYRYSDNILYLWKWTANKSLLRKCEVINEDGGIDSKYDAFGKRVSAGGQSSTKESHRENHLAEQQVEKATTSQIGQQDNQRTRGSWCCPKCNNERFDSDSFAATGTGLSRLFDVQNRHFTTLTCRQCKYTEIYRVKSSALGDVLDFLVGG